MSCRWMRHLKAVALVVLFMMCAILTPSIFAQNANSSIRGTVTDVSGAVLSGAAVDLMNVGTGQHLSTTSSSDGFYTFTNLSPANYKVTASATGFAAWVGVLTLRVSQSALVDPKLNAASVTTQVTVKDVTPIIDQVNATLSDVKEATRIETIPLQSRNILNLLNFSPGVVAGGFAGAGAGYTRVNGIPGGSLDYLVDGQTMTNRFTNELQTNPQPVPTFQEAKIISSNGNAQYSRPGIVELVTKSGTNHFHGQLFELNRNTLLEARTYNSGPSIPYLMHNEFGGQVGGPVIIPKLYHGRDKTFFFVDLEGIRENSAAVSEFQVPLPNWKAGNFSTFVDNNGAPITIYDPATTTLDAATGSYVRKQMSYNGALNVINPNRINSVAAKVMSHIPDPNIPGAVVYQTNNYAVPSQPAFTHNRFYTGKVDQLFGPNRLAMRYTYTNLNQERPYLLLNPDVVQESGHNGAIVFTQVIGANAINVLRGGVQYHHNYTGPQPITPPITQSLGLPTYPDTVAWPGFYWDDQYSSYLAGIDRDNPKDFPDSTITGSDQFSYNRGNHQLMFGFEFQNYRVNTYEKGQPGGDYSLTAVDGATHGGFFTGLMDPKLAAQGTYDQSVFDTGSALADFLLGYLDYADLNVYPIFHTEQSEYAAFAQDDWRATQNLTINFGLRWTYWTPFRDTAGQQSTLNLNSPGGPTVVYPGSGAPNLDPAVVAAYKKAGLPLESATAAGFPSSLWNMPKFNWDPRIGFAYQLNTKTVLRGGFGVYHWVMPLVQYQQQTRRNAPFSYSFQFQPSFVDNAAAELEFPIASPQYGGPQPLTAFMLGKIILNTNALAIQQGSGWNITPWDVNYHPQTVQEYNLTLERELPGHVGAQISYVGNRSTHLVVSDPINAEIPRALAPPGATDPQRRIYPNFNTSNVNTMDLMRFDGYSNSNELQTQIQHTFGSGLLLQAFYTWSRTLGTVQGQNNSYKTLEMLPAALTNNAPESQRLRAVYGPDSDLPSHTFSINGHYEFPFGRGKKFLSDARGWRNALVSGYNISPFFYWRSGLYFSPYSYNSTSSRSYPVVLAPGKTGILPEGKRSPKRWFDASVQEPGQPYTGQTYISRSGTDVDFLPNIPRNYMTGPGFNNLDATIYKLTPLTRGTVLDIEAQIFNVYNHQNLSLPNNTGVITSPVSGSLPRLIQLQAKYIF